VSRSYAPKVPWLMRAGLELSPHDVSDEAAARYRTVTMPRAWGRRSDAASLLELFGSGGGLRPVSRRVVGARGVSGIRVGGSGIS
jgi:hypothetical protein